MSTKKTTKKRKNNLIKEEQYLEYNRTWDTTIVLLFTFVEPVIIAFTVIMLISSNSIDFISNIPTVNQEAVNIFGVIYIVSILLVGVVCSSIAFAKSIKFILDTLFKERKKILSGLIFILSHIVLLIINYMIILIEIFLLCCYLPFL